MKYRKSPWNKEQNWECGTVRGPEVTEPDSSWRFFLQALLSSLQALLSSRHGSSASKGGAREKLHPQLPCSLEAKLKGKLNLNWQVKLKSPRLRKAISTVFVFLPSAVWWERAPPHQLLASAEEWLFWALRRWSAGATAHMLCSPTPSHPEEVWGAHAVRKAR